jgi:RNA polymerase sigma factor (sigma-70 family)
MADDVSIDSDEELVARIGRGDDDALRALLRMHGGRVRGWLGKTYGSVLQDEELDEALGTAVLKVWQNVAKFDSSRGSLGGWFLRIAQREAINILRRDCAYRSSHRELTFDVADDAGPSSSCESEGRDPSSQPRVHALRQIIYGLPPKQKAIILADLAAGGPADAERLALELQTSANSIYVLRNRAREYIQKAMRGQGYYQEGGGDS